MPWEDWKRARTFERKARRPAWRWGMREPNPAARVRREIRAAFVVSARFLFELHQERWPHGLSGDMRTSKSNVMRREARRGKQGIRRWENPNRGVMQTKILGLWEDWRQTIEVERWRLHEKLARHYLICPRCGEKKDKLFMVLCTEREFEDAQIAQAWLRQRDALGGSGPGTAGEAALVARYGLLFEPRGLLCRGCLGMRYGEVKAGGGLR